MTLSAHRLLVAGLALALGCSSMAQRVPIASSLLLPQPDRGAPIAAPGDGMQMLLAFKESDIKFDLNAMMDTLRDHQHEGWVLAVYPDPITGHPLIGAGFSLDVPAIRHAQIDAKNPRLFVEPSSAELWQAAGLDPLRLQTVLNEFARNQADWSDRTYRRKVVRQTLTPQLNDEEALRLLRISAIQAVMNAKAYCRSFDRLSGPQQMALSQLVFQMGTNLEQFVQFLDTLNDEDNARELARLDGYFQTDAGHWRQVQETLMDSQWARRYSVRAATVIAMFDPAYSDGPGFAEERVRAVLHPVVVVRSVRGRKGRLSGKRKVT